MSLLFFGLKKIKPVRRQLSHWEELPRIKTKLRQIQKEKERDTEKNQSQDSAKRDGDRTPSVSIDEPSASAGGGKLMAGDKAAGGHMPHINSAPAALAGNSKTLTSSSTTSSQKSVSAKLQRPASIKEDVDEPEDEDDAEQQDAARSYAAKVGSVHCSTAVGSDACP